MSADLKRVVRIVFQGDNETQKAFNELQSGLNDLEGGVRSVTGPMAELAEKTLKTQAALAAMGTAGLAYSVSKFREFEDAMLKVRAVMGASEDDYQQLLDITKELGSTTKFTAQEAAEGMQFLAMAGMSAAEAIEALPQVLNLAQAASSEMGTTADLVTNIMRGYRIEVDELEGVTDILTETFLSSNTSLEQLGGAFAQVGPVAQSLGLDIEETAALIGNLADAGYQAERGGTALRNILLGLATPAKDFQQVADRLNIDIESLGFNVREGADVFEALGVKVKDAHGNLRPVPDIIDELNTGLGRIPDPADRAAIAVELFGRRGGPEMLALLGIGGEAVRDFVGTLENASGRTSQVAEEMESGVGGALRGIRSSFESITIAVGEQVSGHLEPTLREIPDIFRAISSEIDRGSFDPVFDALGEVTDDLQTWLEGVAEALPEAFEAIDWAGFLSGMENLSDSLGGIFDVLFQGLDPTNVDDLTKIIQTLVDGLGNLAHVSAGIVSEWRPMFEMLGKLTEGFANLGSGAAETGGRLLGAAHKAEFLWERLGFGKGTLALLATEMNASEDASTGMGESFKWMINPAEQVFDMSHRLVDGFFSLGRSAEETEPDLRKLGEGIESLPDEKDFKLNLDEATWNTLDQELEELMQGVDIPVSANTDTPTFRTLEEELDLLAAGVDIPADLDPEDRVPRKAADIETQLEWNARVEISEVERDIAKIEADAAIVQTQVEWEAKLDIAEVEQAAETMRTAIQAAADVSMAQIQADADTWVATAGTISSGFYSIADSLSAAYGALSPDLHWEDFRRIIARIDRELDQRDRLLDMQEDMVSAQVDYLEARTQAMQDGQAMIEIDGAGLQPHLEAFMWEVLSAIQVRVNEEGMGMLLGTQAGIEA